MCVRSVCVCVAVYGMVTVAKVKVAVKIMCCAYVEQHVAKFAVDFCYRLHGFRVQSLFEQNNSKPTKLAL